MAGEEAALGLLGSLLALPYSIPAGQQARQQQAAIRSALSKSGGEFTPEVTNAMMQATLATPPPALGHDIPVLGQLSAGIGTAGRVIQSLAGTGTPAPRPADFINSLAGIQKLRQSQRVQDIGEQLKDPMARELWKAGKTKEAWAIEHPKVNQTELAAWKAEHPNGSIEEYWAEKKRRGGAGGGSGAAGDVEPSLKGAPSAEKDIEEHAQLQYKKDHGGLTPQEQQRLDVLDLKAKSRTQIAGDKEDLKTKAAVERQKQLQRIKDFALTNTTKTMIERAPTVVFEANKVLHLLDRVRVGPAAGRWQEMMTTEAGFANPEYRKLRTDLGLLTSAITQMHVGNRAAEGIAAEFKKTIGETSQDPENLRASLEEILDYAAEVQARRGTPPTPAAGPSAASPATAPALPPGWSVDIHP